MHLDCLYRRILQEVTDKILACDAKDNIIFANNSIRRTLGYSTEGNGGEKDIDKHNDIVGNRIDVFDSVGDNKTFLSLHNARGYTVYFYASVTKQRATDGSIEFKVSIIIALIPFITLLHLPHRISQ